MPSIYFSLSFFFTSTLGFFLTVFCVSVLSLFVLFAAGAKLTSGGWRRLKYSIDVNCNPGLLLLNYQIKQGTGKQHSRDPTQVGCHPRVMPVEELEFFEPPTDCVTGMWLGVLSQLWWWEVRSLLQESGSEWDCAHALAEGFVRYVTSSGRTGLNGHDEVGQP